VDAVNALTSLHDSSPDSGETTLRALSKRAFDLLFSFVGLTVLLPLGICIAALIKAADRGPVFYGQIRVGQFGKPFRIWKFRSMRVDADGHGLHITRDRDPRITRVGRFLRKTKLDELPQLWNVLVGQMSFVGPRPEVPKYVALYTAEQRKVLQLKPGITDVASIEFRDEEAFLEAAPDVESAYVNYCIPRKIELNQHYARTASLLNDLRVILRTVSAVGFRGKAARHPAIPLRDVSQAGRSRGNREETRKPSESGL